MVEDVEQELEMLGTNSRLTPLVHIRLACRVRGGDGGLIKVQNMLSYVELL